MERAERMILLGAGFLSTVLLMPVLWLLLGADHGHRAGRFVKVWRVAEAPKRSAHAPTPADSYRRGRSGVVRPRRRGGGPAGRPS